MHFSVFRVYYGDCKKLFDAIKSNTDQIQCTDKCRQSLIDWNQPTNPYQNLTNGTCGFSERCLAQIHRLERCTSNYVSSEIHKNYLPNGCVTVYQICTKKPSCNVALRKFYGKCNKVISGEVCTPDCKKALNRLESVGGGYRSCICDGNVQFEGVCLAMRNNIEKLCNWIAELWSRNSVLALSFTMYRKYLNNGYAAKTVYDNDNGKQFTLTKTVLKFLEFQKHIACAF